MRYIPSERFCWLMIIGGGLFTLAVIFEPLVTGRRSLDWDLAFSGTVSLFGGLWFLFQRRLPPRL